MYVERGSIAFSKWIVKHRWVVMTLSLLSVSALGLFMTRLTFDTNYRIWFEEEDRYLIGYDHFLKEFGNDDMFAVAFKDQDGVLREKPINAIKRLTKALWQVRGIIRVDSLTNFQGITGSQDAIAIRELFPVDQPVTSDLLTEAEQYIRRDPLLIGSLITESKQVAIIRGKFAPNAMTPDLPATVYTQIQTILAKETAESGYQFFVVGGPVTDHAFNLVAETDMGRLIPLLLVVFIGVLGLMFRSVWGIVVPLATGILSIVCTLGLSGLLRYDLNAITAGVPQLLLGITVATTMHVFASFLEALDEGLSSPEAAERSLQVNLVPICLTNVTTALGFASFAFASVLPVQRLGIIAGFGSLVIMLLSITAVPAALSFYSNSETSRPRIVPWSHWFYALGRHAITHRRTIISVWLSLAVVALALLPQLVVDSNPLGYFKSGYWFRNAVDFVEKEGSGGALYEIIVRGPGPDSIKTAAYMRDLDELTKYLSEEAPGEFRNVYSLSTIIRNLNRAMHADDPRFHRIPSDGQTIAEYLLLYTLSVPVGQDINDRMNVDNSASRVTVTRALESTRESRKHIDEITRWAEGHLHNAKIEFTGRDVLYTNMGNNITDTLITSLKFDALTILPILVLMFGSLMAGVVSVLANVLPLIIVLGFMAQFGILLDVGTVMVGSLGLGIAVDDTVHLLAHYYTAKRNGQLSQNALCNTLSQIGVPVTVTTLTLMMSFIVFVFADFMPNLYFGALISLVVFLALLADLTLTPALIAVLDIKSIPVSTRLMQWAKNLRA